MPFGIATLSDWSLTQPPVTGQHVSRASPSHAARPGNTCGPHEHVLVAGTHVASGRPHAGTPRSPTSAPHRQRPPAQLSPVTHRIPHPPQLSASVKRSAQYAGSVAQQSATHARSRRPRARRLPHAQRPATQVSSTPHATGSGCTFSYDFSDCCIPTPRFVEVQWDYQRCMHGRWVSVDSGADAYSCSACADRVSESWSDDCGGASAASAVCP